MKLKGDVDAPLYRRVYETIRDAILDGTLAPGTRVPGTRALSQQFGVSRIVVLAAFEQLAAEGYVVSRPGSGTRVALGRYERPGPAKTVASGPVSRYAGRARSLAPHVSRPSKKAKIDFAYAETHVDDKTLKLWRQALGAAVQEAARGDPDSSGWMPLRVALAGYLRQERGVEADPEQLLIVGGSQQALDLTARVVCDPGTVIGIEDPHYQGTRAIFSAAGAKLAVCAIDEDGLDADRHAKKLARASAVVVTPSHQFPTGAIMPVDRRWKLLQWARRQRAWIIEDDYDCEFRYGVGAVPALQGLDTSGRVIYIGTFARTLFPSIRLGYVVVPPALLEAFRAVKWLADRGSALVSQVALASMIESGAYESARRRMARRLAASRETLLHALEVFGDDVVLSGARSGTHVYLRFPRLPAAATQSFLDAALQRGVRAYDARPYHVTQPRDARLIVGYTTVDERDVAKGVRVLFDVYRKRSK